VLVIDLDTFKLVNDTHGHLAGDAVLRAVADALRAEVRDHDLAGRFGGDEYTVLLTRPDGHPGRHDTAGLLAVAERISRRVAALHVDAPTLRHGTVLITGLSVSIGGAPLPDHAPDLDTSFQLADAALYDAKRAGRGLIRIAAPMSRPTGPPPAQRHGQLPPDQRTAGPSPRHTVHRPRRASDPRPAGVGDGRGDPHLISDLGTR
jgi:diguanylate cyclase (GGDEF)-like protein